LCAEKVVLEMFVAGKGCRMGCAVERVVSGSGKEGFAFITADDAVEARPF
jgi:hypothetical protein